MKEEAETEIVIDTSPEYLHDVKCDCAHCKQFLTEYVHELDIFSTVKFLLDMDTQLDYADFKAIYVFGKRTTEDGLFEGKCFTMNDDDNVALLVKELQEKQAAKEKKEMQLKK